MELTKIKMEKEKITGIFREVRSLRPLTMVPYYFQNEGFTIIYPFIEGYGFGYNPERCAWFELDIRKDKVLGILSRESLKEKLETIFIPVNSEDESSGHLRLEGAYGV